MYETIFRELLKVHQGYEVIFSKDKNNGEGSFCLAFQNSMDAFQWCTAVQKGLLELVHKFCLVKKQFQ